MNRVDTNCLIYRNTLVCSPSLPVPTRTRDHGLNGHEWREGSRLEIRTGGHSNTGVNQTPIRHHVLHHVFAVKVKLVAVVIRIRTELRWDKIQGFHTGNQIVIKKTDR